MAFTSVNKTFEKAIRDNWDRPAISNYQGATMHYRDLARLIAKLHIMFEECGLEKATKWLSAQETKPIGLYRSWQ